MLACGLGFLNPTTLRPSTFAVDAIQILMAAARSRSAINQQSQAQQSTGKHHCRGMFSFGCGANLETQNNKRGVPLPNVPHRQHHYDSTTDTQSTKCMPRSRSAFCGPSSQLQLAPPPRRPPLQQRLLAVWLPRCPHNPPPPAPTAALCCRCLRIPAPCGSAAAA